MSSGEMLDSGRFVGLKKSSIAKDTGVQLNGSKTGSTLIICDGFIMGGGTSRDTTLGTRAGSVGGSSLPASVSR